MRNFLFFILTLFPALSFGSNKIIAQKANLKKEAIIIEFSASGINKERFEFSIPKRSFLGESHKGFSECLFCRTQEEFANFIGYEFLAELVRVNKNSASVFFQIEFNDCKIRKSFLVKRNQKRQIRLKCGASLTAYYGFETEEVD